MTPIERIAVVVPAADEQDTIGACLQALLVARDHAERQGLGVRIVVVLDECTDSTADEVAVVDGVLALEHSGRNVGLARAAGTALALAEDPDPAGLLIASTDADSRVPSDWLVGLAAEAAGADLVLGTVLPDLGLTAGVSHAWHARHVLVEGHPYVHAANLAVRASTYTAVGGWAPLRAGEDEDLADRIVAAGGRVVRTARIPVHTSVRAQGRAPRGFSSYLRSLGHR